MTFFRNLFNEQDGQDMVEYGLVVALIAMIVLAGVTLFGTNLNTGINAQAGTIASKVK